MPSVFISYSHDSDSHRDFVRGIADRLRLEGVDCLIDQYINGFPEQGWQRWMEDQIEVADFVLLVCTETYLRRFRGHETQGGKGVNFEGVVISQALYDSYYKNTKFVPIIPNNGSFDRVPAPLKSYSTYRIDNQYEDVYRIITGQAKYQQPDLGAIRKLPPAHTESSRRIYSDDLPTVEGKLFGRKDELALLDQALSEPSINIVQFVASGGTGKTKLIRTWLDNNSDKIDHLIAWSFYSQGSSEDKQISATPFFMQAMKSLGSDTEISDFNTEEEKGEHIADLLRERRCLLVLDGLEPLQQVGRGMRGELKDRAIRKLLRCLVGSHSSLCIITTRLPVHELKGRRQVIQHDLQNLAPEDGVALLRSFGVSGRDSDMLAAVVEYGRHALALHLLGNALATYLDGDVRRRDTLGELIGDYDEVERHAFKVMQAYERWLEGTVELKLLYLLGLFDHPVEQEVLEVLWEAEISGLTEGVDRKAWLVAQRNLISKYRMMAEKPSPQPLSLTERGAKDNTFDCHPLIREYFGRRLRENEVATWRQAHTVLYEHYKGLPKRKFPKKLSELRLLLNAVIHGSKAGLYEQSLWLYSHRIQWDGWHYLSNKFSISSESLSALSNFFTKLWLDTFPLSDRPKAGLLNWVALDLYALGFIKEAVEPMKLSAELRFTLRDWGEVELNFRNISEFYLCLGQVERSIEYARRAVYYGKRHSSIFSQVASLTTLARCLHQSNNKASAHKAFRDAEQIQREKRPEEPYLYSVQGYYYCELLLDEGKVSEASVRSRASSRIHQNHEEMSILSNALSELSQTQVSHYQGSWDDAALKSTKATSYLQKAGIQQYLCFGLLTSALISCKKALFRKAFQNLSDVYEYSKPSSMRLHLTDYHLEMARLILAVETDPTQYPEATPDREKRTLPFADQEEPGILTLEGHIAEADQLIQKTGYHRRDAELAELKQQAGMAC